jgi:hypothetical protein
LAADLRRTHLVHRVFKDLVARAQPGTGIRPGAINAALRELGEPMGAWEVRGELSNLEASGDVRCEPETGLWFLVPADANRTKKRSSA